MPFYGKASPPWFLHTLFINAAIHVIDRCSTLLLSYLQAHCNFTPFLCCPSLPIQPFLLIFCFLARSRGLSVQRITELLNHSSGRIELAAAHISFYLRRLRKNVPLIRGFLGSKGYVFDETKDSSLISFSSVLKAALMFFQIGSSSSGRPFLTHQR